ncbi:hypothetical protein EDC45_0422 [Mesocricetibacter intestinalis]|uniref:Uncharacterized protein n=1 Tax=Mesocricetibacter intestinalis TaxID=1521930 RepID=A0A4R6VFW4_9PAST|nr:hypothetical protein EDC45_0422 [Mesocricetibacter intestinalis]
MSEQQPSVLRFETAVAAKDYEVACRELLNILGKLDENFGLFNGIDCDYPQQLNGLEKERTIYICTRLANAIGELFADRALSISGSGAKQFFIFQRWLALIFAASPYVNADHILQHYNLNKDKETSHKEFVLEGSKEALIKFCILYFPDSNVNINLEALWNADQVLCASLCFALQSPRFIGTDAAFSKRATVLQWFPQFLESFDSLDALPANILHDVYMHCSYDTAANKHQVKGALNKVVRRHLLNGGWTDRENLYPLGERNNKPVMVVMLEHFHSAHSIYRTHSTSMIAARQHFYLIGLGSDAVDEAGR